MSPQDVCVLSVKLAIIVMKVSIKICFPNIECTSFDIIFSHFTFYHPDLKVRVPKFSKHSWLAFPALRGAYKHVQLRIEFRPESFDGIILLSGERDDLTGDFMALLLNKGFVEFWFVSKYSSCMQILIYLH